MNEQWDVKIADEHDFDRWIEFAKSVVSDFFEIDLPNDPTFRNGIVKNISRKTALYVEYQSIITGAMTYSPNTSQITWLAVHKDYRRMGIGTALVKHMFSLIPDREEYIVKTFMPEDSGSIVSHPFYESFGFVASEIDYSVMEHNADHPMLVFRKKGTASPNT